VPRSSGPSARISESSYQLQTFAHFPQLPKGAPHSESDKVKAATFASENAKQC